MSAAMDARLVVIHQANAGVSAARNAGREQAKGELIVFVDADDYLEDAFLERMTVRLPEDAQIISCCAKTIGDDFTATDHFFSDSRVFTGYGNGPAGETAAEGSAFLCCAKKDKNGTRLFDAEKIGKLKQNPYVLEAIKPGIVHSVAVECLKGVYLLDTDQVLYQIRKSARNPEDPAKFYWTRRKA